ncbi:MAG: helix-hairpin-helix domain-containing protein [Actinomycetota bacterium]
MADILIESGLKEKVEALIGRRRDVMALGVVVVTVLVLATMLWARRAPAQVAPPAAAAPEPSATTSAGVVYVHVGGAVKKPGLYEFPADSRIAHAIEIAGPLRAADIDALNLAEILVDGTKIDVPRRGEQVSPAVSATGGPAPGAAAAVNLNTADASLLETIPGVGPVTAGAILDFRTENGPFTSIDQLLDVSGIGPATLEEMRSYVTI